MERRAYFEAVKLHKYFPGVHALNDVTITADKGSVWASLVSMEQVNLHL